MCLPRRSAQRVALRLGFCGGSLHHHSAAAMALWGMGGMEQSWLHPMYNMAALIKRLIWLALVGAKMTFGVSYSDQ